MPLFNAPFTFPNNVDGGPDNNTALEHYLHAPYNHYAKAIGLDGQTFNNGAQTLINLNAVDYDPEGMISLANDAITIPVEGVWTCAAGNLWASNVAGYRLLGIAAVTAAATTFYYLQGGPAAPITSGTAQTGSIDLTLKVGDQILAWAQQDSGIVLANVLLAQSIWLSVKFVSRLNLETSIG